VLEGGKRPPRFTPAASAQAQDLSLPIFRGDPSAAIPGALRVAFPYRSRRGDGAGRSAVSANMISLHLRRSTRSVKPKPSRPQGHEVSRRDHRSSVRMCEQSSLLGGNARATSSFTACAQGSCTTWCATWWELHPGGKGSLKSEDIARILAARNRTAAGRLNRRWIVPVGVEYGDAGERVIGAAS